METMNNCTPNLSPRSGRGHLANGEAVGKGAESESISPDGGGIWDVFRQRPVPDCTEIPVKGMPDIAPAGLGGNFRIAFSPRLRRGLNDVTRFAGLRAALSLLVISLLLLPSCGEGSSQERLRGGRNGGGDESNPEISSAADYAFFGARSLSGNRRLREGVGLCQKAATSTMAAACKRVN